MTPSEKKLYNRLYYQKKKEEKLRDSDSGSVSKAILNLDAIYNEVSQRHLKQPTEYSKMILENLERPMHVLQHYKQIRDRFDRRIDYILMLLKSTIQFVESEKKGSNQEKEY